MNETGLFKIALFPIPGCISFPQTIIPLHVFEPRYRQMIQDCVDRNMLLGVCHTKSIERFAYTQRKRIKSKEELYEQYKQNLTTFAPEDVFSAGQVEINQVTEDGRYHISILMLKRFRILDINQNDPYKIGDCEEYNDDKEININSLEGEIKKQRQFVIDFIADELAKLGRPDHEGLTDLTKEKSLNLFTFKLFKFFRLPEQDMQEILNSKDPVIRLNELYQFVSNLKLQLSK